MRELRNGTKIIGIDHGYGNIKSASTVTPSGILKYDTEPIFSGNVLYPLGLAAGVFSIAGNYLGTRVFTAKGSRGVKPIMITVLGIFFIKLCYELFFAK